MNAEDEDVLMNRFLSKQRPSLSEASQGSFRHSFESVLASIDPPVVSEGRDRDAGLAMRQQANEGKCNTEFQFDRKGNTFSGTSRLAQSGKPGGFDEPLARYGFGTRSEAPTASRLDGDVLVHSEYTPVGRAGSPFAPSRDPKRPGTARTPERIEQAFLSQINNADTSNMNQVIGAVMKQSETIRRLQQAVADLEIAKQHMPASPPKWGDLKRTLASKSNYAEVEELRSKIKGLEDQVHSMNRKEAEKRASRLDTSTNIKETLKMFESETESPDATMALDEKLQELSSKIERSVTDHVQTILQKSVDLLRTDLKSDFYTLVGNAPFSKSAPLSSSTKIPDDLSYNTSAQAFNSNNLNRIGDILSDLQLRCSNIEGRLTASSANEVDYLRQNRLHLDGNIPPRQKILALDQTLGRLQRDMEAMRTELDQSKKAFGDAAQIKGDDTKIAASRLDEVSTSLQECRRLLSENTQREIQHGNDLSKVLKEMNSLKTQLAERKIAEAELRSRVDSLVIENQRLKESVSDVFDFEQRMQKRIDIHVVALESQRKDIKNLKEEYAVAVDQRSFALAGLKADLLEELARVEKDVELKVDTAVIEELMRHLATRDEVSNILKNVSREISSESRITESLRTDIAEHIRGDVRHDMDLMAETISLSLYEKLANALREELDIMKKGIPNIDDTKRERRYQDRSEKFIAEIGSLRSKLDRHMQACQGEISRISKATENIRNLDVTSLANDYQSKRPTHSPPSRDFAPQFDGIPEEVIKEITQNLARDFDEKFFLLCADLSACKAAYLTAANQPFFKCGQWLWRSNQLKHGSTIPWNYETVNTDPDNFRWEQDQTCIRVAEAGLYEITFAFFTKSRPSIQLVVNGESVLSAINSPTYVVHHGSGFVSDGDGKIEPGSVTGLSLIDFIALPAKSTIALHYHYNKKNQPCHGFLGLKRL
ncbi:hypothetical protein HDU67_009278 [Dinochytrium kinnereticum]|nr:hypothetical protein HDU67_009278 [Dinochytrium kinnereticum]